MIDKKKGDDSFKDDFFNKDDFSSDKFKPVEDEIREPASTSSESIHSFSITDRDEPFDKASESIQGDFNQPITRKVGEEETIEFDDDPNVTEIKSDD